METAIEQAHAIKRGNNNETSVSTVKIEVDDITALRRSVKISQTEFASRLGISVATLRNWEQGRRQPSGPARKLISLLQKSPETVLELELEE